MRLLLSLLLLCGACSETDTDSRGDGITGNQNQSGSSDIPNGSGGTPLAPTGAGMTAPVSELENCSPGTYLGDYTCDLTQDGASMGTLEGPVKFNLDIDENATAGECAVDDEFCFDLVIPEGSGTLFGVVLLLIAFETKLEGGLNCKTGVFHATAVDGSYGGPDFAAPPDMPAVAQPPLGMFDGSLDGMHLGKIPQIIEGMWDLTEDQQNYNCNGPFTVELQP